MLNLLVSVVAAIALSGLVYFITPSYLLSSIVAVITIIGINILMGRVILKRLTAIFNSCEKEIRSGKIDLAIEKMKQGYRYSKWQFMIKSQIDSQIGIILYATKRFNEAMPYLKKPMKRNTMAMSMLATQYYRNKDYDNMKKIVNDLVSVNKKDSFSQSLGAYLYSEIGNRDKAIDILNNALKKMPMDEKIEHNLDSLKNNKKLKMQTYGSLWMQLHLAKTPDGVKQYQTLIGRQKITRR